VEAAAAAKLNHPNILPVYEFGLHNDEVHFIAMPFVQGRTLRDRISTGTMTPGEAASLTLTLAKAVAHAHERDILHRDLKPSNILLDENQNPLIMDFGLAVDLSSDGQLTRSSQILGTPQFMPPEQAGQKDSTTDFRSDVYGLGALLYYALKGGPPFNGATAMDVINRVLHEDPESPRAADKTIPRDLETICLKCLEKEKDKRYQTATELAQDLELFLEGKPIIARPLPRLERMVRWCRRKPQLATIIGLLLLFTLGATATAGVMAQLRMQERDARLAEETARRDNKDLAIYAREQQICALLQSSDATEMAFSFNSDTSNMAWNAASVDSALVQYRKEFSLPKLSSFCSGETDWRRAIIRASCRF
jgi:serine/threonine-protein kinase